MPPAPHEDSSHHPAPADAPADPAVGPGVKRASPAPAARPVYHLRGWRLLALWPVGALARLWTSSLRLEVDPDSRSALTFVESPVICVMWHDQLFVAGELYRRYRGGRRAWGLISASRDGAWLAAFFQLLGIHSVRGSSSRRALPATRELLDKLLEGDDLGVTPDGPRGPRYVFKPGVAMLARHAGAPILLMHVVYRPGDSWQLRSWDRFHLPKPFSRLRVRARLLRLSSDDARDREELARDLGQALERLDGSPD